MGCCEWSEGGVAEAVDGTLGCSSGVGGVNDGAGDGGGEGGRRRGVSVCAAVKNRR